MKTCTICSTPYSASRQDLSFHWYVPKIDEDLGEKMISVFQKKPS
jgi:hypothetical protein